MNDWQKKVRAFHIATGQPHKSTPGDISDERKLLRERLIREEFYELVYAMDKGLMAATADAIADLLYVVLGTAVELGIDMDPIFQAVHNANMTKINGPVREDGKQLKPEGWQPPDIEKLLDDQISEAAAQGLLGAWGWGD
jgi:predicted HAD superfamily Cof-like phosphohydrolase